MIPRCFVLVMVAGACGTVANEPMDAAVGMPTTYKGRLDQTTPAMFGGGPMGYCTYTMSLKQLTVEVGMLPSGEVTSGRVQDLQVEAIVGTCMYAPAAPSIASYAFVSATPNTAGMMLTFEGEATNATKTSLVVNLSASGPTQTAAMVFHRTDLGAPLDWRVAVTVPLAAP
jgi:hypothetical protein